VRELQAKLEELENAFYCAICFDARLQVVFQCGHQVRVRVKMQLWCAF